MHNPEQAGKNQSKVKRRSRDANNDTIENEGKHPDPETGVCGRSPWSVNNRLLSISARRSCCLGWRKVAGKGQAAILAKLRCRGVLGSALGTKDKVFWH